MPNVLNLYDPLFYAQEGIAQLEKALGIAGRIHRGFQAIPAGRGSTIKINKPGTFTAQDEPSTAQDLTPDDVELRLTSWKGVKFQLTDKELTFTGEKIINDHIRPMAYAIADAIDQDLALLANDVPWFDDLAATPDYKDIVNANTGLFNQNVPMDEEALHLMMDGNLYGALLKDPVFAQADSDANGGTTQMRGSLGRKFGFELFRNQNVKSHVKGTLSTPTLTLTGAHAAQAETVTLGGTMTGTLLAGDTFVIAGNTQRYAVTGGPWTAAANAFTGVTITPPLAQAYSGGAVVTVSLDDHVMNLAFHRDFAALGMAPLSTVGNGLGARMETISDPITSLALRSRIWYEGNTSKVFVGLDALWGVKTLDPNKARRLRG